MTGSVFSYPNFLHSTNTNTFSFSSLAYTTFFSQVLITKAKQENHPRLIPKGAMTPEGTPDFKWLSCQPSYLSIIIGFVMHAPFYTG